MADIRINALATTAASTASDDFLAVDGSANGTRKLNAYSPTFGGNVTASGNLTVSGGGQSYVDGSLRVGSATTPKGKLDAQGTYDGSAPSTSSTPIIRANNGGAVSLWTGGQAYTCMWQQAIQDDGSNNTKPIALQPLGGPVLIGTTTDGGQKLQVAGTVAKTAAGPTTIAIASNEASNLRDEGRLFIVGNASAGSRYLGLEYYDVGNGAYRNVAAVPNGGNFLIGGTTDGGQKLQVSGTVAFTGDLYSASAGSTWGADSGATGFLVYGAGGGANANKLVFRTNSTTALTLDNSQNATFAGAVQITTNASSVSRKLVIFDSSSANNTQGIEFSNTTLGSSGSSAYIRAIRTSSSGSNTDLTFGTMLSGVVSEVLKLDSSQNATFAGKVTVSKANAGLDTSVTVNNTDSAANSTSSLILTSVAGSWTIQNNRSGGHLYFKDPATSATQLQINNSTGLATFAGSIAIGNTVQTAAGVSSTHKVTISIGGTTYYLLATNV